MFVYVTGEKQVTNPAFVMSVAPAALLSENERPAAWLTEHKEPAQINVEFKFGKAEVDKTLGEFLVQHGFAQKSNLIIPAKRALGID